ncbi:MAG: 4Fe-4S dicluster domain-containing protein [Candidatus Omnitrophica bacterium]|nr:4Fe-4S dicluster domain-containing protein [Candidatus Omnitrophota bacterium]
MYYISLGNFAVFLNNLKKDYAVYVPVKKGQGRLYQEYDSLGEDVVIGEVRAIEPLKSFFYRARQVVAEGFSENIPGSRDKALAIVGVKACDLKGFKVQDHVFQDQDCPEPFYSKAREENLIISADCTCAIDTCFCLALGLKPHPEEDFDLNLSEVKGGFVVESGSNKGQALISGNSSLFSEAPKEEVEKRDKQRFEVASAVDKNVKANGIPNQDSFEGVIEKNYDASIWKDEAKACVECGACNVICPTCHCFLLYDQKDAEKMARLRIWDSCMIKDFARVAGGANPRDRLWMRLRNRFEKKFDFFSKVAGVYACTGCGRCISACPAKIDIRKVLNKLVNND